jgi:hypothetical protein
MATADLRALREYVTAETGAQNQAESTVRLVVTHSNLQAKFMEIRLDLHVREHPSARRPAAPPPRRPPPAARRAPPPADYPAAFSPPTSTRA